ncbi:hypothetical protein AUC68_08535 [Methyloceanibacter methanicus]|uniref:Peptidoglycan binding-like domain-containing protein n=2 Tax=Methyloceanibacter methanicus TaxID=1774968 RepID=A0A1E3VY43_9HYPH|nr:hypothetical protein AUC68_08535 [Methyloceanibacter methanicus]
MGLAFAVAVAAGAPGLAHAAPPARTGAIVVAVATPENEAAAPRHPEPLDKKSLTEKVQRCYAKLGYYKGPIDGKANKATWTAHWHFKNEHGLKAHGDFLAKPVLAKIGALCKDEEPQMAGTEGAVSGEAATATVVAELASETDSLMEPTPQALSEAVTASEVTASEVAVSEVAASEGATPEGSAPDDSAPTPASDVAPPRARSDIECLPEDLLAALRAAHGPGVTARACAPGCLPARRASVNSSWTSFTAATGSCGAAPAFRSRGIFR